MILLESTNVIYGENKKKNMGFVIIGLCTIGIIGSVIGIYFSDFLK